MPMQKRKVGKTMPGLARALVESEKTAIICACLNPDCVWLATGGKGQLNDRVEVLAGRKVIAFPDVDGYDTWVQKAAERQHELVGVMEMHTGLSELVPICDVLFSAATQATHRTDSSQHCRHKDELERFTC